MANNEIFRNYISKILINQNKNNEDITKINTQFLSNEGDVFTLDVRTLSPIVIPTTSSIQGLQPEVSSMYPFKIVPPIESDGTSLLLSPNIRTSVTASQNYYSPIYFERYRKVVLEAIDREFVELTVPELAIPGQTVTSPGE